MNQQGMAQLLAGFAALKLTHIPSFGNFVCVKIGATDNPNGGANAVFQKLLKAGVIVRPVASYGMPEYLRISIGTTIENGKFLATLKDALQ